MIYGEYVKEYNDTADIARMFLADFFKEINSFDYLEEITTINEQYVEQIIKEVYNVSSAIIYRFLVYLNSHFFIIILFYLMIMKLSVESFLTQLYKLLNQILSMKLLPFQNPYQIIKK